MNYAPMPDSAYSALMAAARNVKEEKQMKRKLSVGLVFAVVMILLAGIAFAIVHFNEYASRIADMEAEKGYYDTWSVEDRVALVGMLVESGALVEDDRVKTLLSGTLDEAAASALATEIITEWGPTREDAITLMSILETAKGPMGHWSPEDKAWYYDLLREKGLLGADTGIDNPIMPTNDSLSQAEAEQIAFDAIAEAYRFDPVDLKTYKVGAEFSEIPSLNREPIWIITFYPPEPNGGYKQYSGYLAVIDSKTGEVIEVPELDYDTPAQRVAQMGITPEQQRERTALYDTKGHHLYWSHQERALYLPDRFCMPSPYAIPEDEAIRIAWETTKNHEQIIPEKLVGYDTAALYCTALQDADSLFTEPYWSIVLIDEDPNAGPYGTTYGEVSIMLNAKTGEVICVEGFGDAYIFKGHAQ